MLQSFIARLWKYFEPDSRCIGNVVSVTGHNDDSNRTECAICFTDIGINDLPSGKLFPCRHNNMFHMHCGWNWVLTQNNFNIGSATLYYNPNLKFLRLQCPLCMSVQNLNLAE